MAGESERRDWFWLTLSLSSITIVAIVLAVWELIQNQFFRDLDYLTLHYLYITRGIVSSLLLAFWAAWLVLRERKDKEQQLRTFGERYRGILDSGPSAVVLFDAALQVSEWNAAAERTYGWEKHQVIGKPLPTVPEHKRAELDALCREVDRGSIPGDIETQRCRRDGVLLDVQLALLPFQQGEQRWYLEATSDIRERVRMREQWLQLEKLTTMGQMAAGTAHHLNTPLASMLLRLRMMQEGLYEGSLKEEIDRLEASVRFCQHFVRRLLDLSRCGRSEPQPQLVRSTVEAVASFLAPQFVAKQAILRTEFEPPDGQMVVADRSQLESLLMILLSNSLDAIPRGGNVRVACRSKANDRVEIEISDDGSGIDPTVQSRILEPFFTTKPPGQGTGLGLAIAAQIVHEHKGNLRIVSQPGRGTSAYVELPTLPRNGGQPS